jgi:hypothetical protein
MTSVHSVGLGIEVMIKRNNSGASVSLRER